MFSSIPIAGLGVSQTALHGILAALHVRNCGLGKNVETSLFQCALAKRGPMLAEAEEIEKFRLIIVLLKAVGRL